MDWIFASGWLEFDSEGLDNDFDRFWSFSIEASEALWYFYVLLHDVILNFETIDLVERWILT